MSSSIQCKTQIKYIIALNLITTCTFAGLPDCAQIAQAGCNICHLQAVTGPCEASIPRWYYDVDRRTAKNSFMEVVSLLEKFK